MEKKYGASKAYKDKTDAGKARKDNRKAKRLRKGEEKADKKKYGKGEEGKTNKMAALAKAAADRKQKRADSAISSQTSPTADGASMPNAKTTGMPNPNAKKPRKKKKPVKNVPIKGKGSKGKKRIKKSPTSSETERKDLLKYSPVADRERDAMRKMGGSMYNKKMGSSMNGEKYDAKEAYNKDLSASSRLHYLENERHDKTSGHPIHKHMKGFGGSMKLQGHGASLPGTPAGSKSKRMTNLATNAMNKRPAQYTDSGQNFIDANNNLIQGSRVDEGELSPVIRKSPMRRYVETIQTSKVPMRPNSAALPGGGKPGEKLFLSEAKMGQKATMTKAPKKRMQQSMKSIPKKRMQASMRGVKVTPTKMRSGQMKRGVKVTPTKK